MCSSDLSNVNGEHPVSLAVTGSRGGGVVGMPANIGQSHNAAQTCAAGQINRWWTIQDLNLTKRPRFPRKHAGTVAKTVTTSSFDAELDVVVEAWPRLNARVRAAVLALVQAVGGSDAQH